MRPHLAQHQLGRGAVSGRQAGAQVGQAGAGLGVFVHAGAAVSHPQPGDAAHAFGADLDRAAVLGRVDAVAHRVLRQRQQGHRGQRHRVQRVIHAQAVAQPVGQAHAHQLEVGTHQRQFVVQGRLGVVQARHGGAQVGDQALQHLGGARRAGFHQGLHVGQRVEEKVRLDLALQQRQPRVHRLLLEPAALEFDLQRQRARARLALAQLRRQGDQEPEAERHAADDEEAGQARLAAGEVGDAAAHRQQVDHEGAQRRRQGHGQHGQQPARQPARQPVLGQALRGHEHEQTAHRNEERASQQHPDRGDEDRRDHGRGGDGEADRDGEAALAQRGTRAVPRRRAGQLRVGGGLGMHAAHDSAGRPAHQDGG